MTKTSIQTVLQTYTGFFKDSHACFICDGIYNLATPWGRNGWVKDFRIENVGFKPDVSIPEGEKDWIGFVQKYYAKENTEKK